MVNTGVASLNRNEATIEKRIKKRVPGLSLFNVIKTRKALNHYVNSKNRGYKNFRKSGLPVEVSERVAYDILYGNNNNTRSMNQMNKPMNKPMNEPEPEPMAPIVVPNSMANNPSSPMVNSPRSSYNNFMKKYGKTAKAPVRKPWISMNRGGRRTRSKATKSKSRKVSR
jgi:polygalacturonase